MQIKSLTDLIQEYKEMASICHNIDYADKKSVKANNKAVKRMYGIVNLIKADFGENGTVKFEELLDVEENGTHIWAAVHMLEKLSFNKESEKKALQIIKKEAKSSMGMEIWLKAYLEKH